MELRRGDLRRAFPDDLGQRLTGATVTELGRRAKYGLVGTVYSRSISRGLSVAHRIKAGMVHVNDGPLNDEATIPFGGTGMSGNGSRYGGEANADNFTEWQWVTVRDQPPTFPF